MRPGLYSNFPLRPCLFWTWPHRLGVQVVTVHPTPAGTVPNKDPTWPKSYRTKETGSLARCPANVGSGRKPVEIPQWDTRRALLGPEPCGESKALWGLACWPSDFAPAPSTPLSKCPQMHWARDTTTGPGLSGEARTKGWWLRTSLIPFYRGRCISAKR